MKSWPVVLLLLFLFSAPAWAVESGYSPVPPEKACFVGLKAVYVSVEVRDPTLMNFNTDMLEAAIALRFKKAGLIVALDKEAGPVLPFFTMYCAGFKEAHSGQLFYMLDTHLKETVNLRRGERQTVVADTWSRSQPGAAVNSTDVFDSAMKTVDDFIAAWRSVQPTFSDASKSIGSPARMPAPGSARE